jgi:Trypsin
MTFDAYNPVNDVLRLSMNIAKGEDGTCNGDSGGPVFYTDQSGSRVQVSLVSGGDAPCRATNTGPGFSSQKALDFVACGKVAGDVTAVKACVDGVVR